MECVTFTMEKTRLLAIIYTSIMQENTFLTINSFPKKVNTRSLCKTATMCSRFF